MVFDYRSATIYQIYPRSFCDSNGDGVGDLPGIVSRLDYIRDLGVDAVWISPFFRSPMRDFGYDVSDYRSVDPLFGTNDDFRHLLDAAHDRSLKIIIDLVMNHTSDQHPWFQESRRRRDTDKADWYVWCDAKVDGSPPNNWVSVFGGPAWTFDFYRGQYYLHHFLKEQPSLNFRAPAVRAEMLDIARHYFAMGVDGLRLDVINFLFHDAALRDNPPCAPTARTQYDGIDPYNMQAHIHDKSQPEVLDFIAQLRRVCGEFDDRFLIGEIGDDNSLARLVDYTNGPNRLHTAYHLGLGVGQRTPLTKAFFVEAITAAERARAGTASTLCWAFSNHDIVRTVTRFSPDETVCIPVAKLLLSLLLALPGIPMIYQGEELGLTEAVLSFDQLQDPWGKNLYPKWQGRDGCRTPIPWDDSLPRLSWLPIPDDHRTMNVEHQLADADSVLNHAYTVLRFRQSNPALQTGGFRWIDTPDDVLGFERYSGDQVIRCLFNLSDRSYQVAGIKLAPFEARFTLRSSAAAA